MALRATGHTLPLETGTKRKGEAFRTGAWIPKPHQIPTRGFQMQADAIAETPEGSQALLPGQGAAPSPASPHGSLPKTTSFHQVTLNSQINSRNSPPTLSWQSIKDKVFIK